MKHKKILLVLVLGVVALLLPARAAADGDTVEKRLRGGTNGELVSLSAAQELVVWHGWGACTPGLWNSNVKAMLHVLELDDTVLVTPEDDAQYWGPMGFEPLSPGYCNPQQKSAFGRWTYRVGHLSVGYHELHLHLWTDHPITDGGDFNGDGHPDAAARFEIRPWIRIQVCETSCPKEE